MVIGGKVHPLKGLVNFVDMKRILVLYLLALGFGSYGQNFLDSAYLVNSNPYSVRRLIPNDTAASLERPGNLIYRGVDSSLYFSSGYKWTKVPKSEVDVYAIAKSQVDSAHGWAEYIDGQYTSEIPLVVLEGDTVLITINNALKITSQLPLGVDSLWDSSNNKIIPSNVGDAYTMRLDFVASSSNNNGYGEVLLDIGGSLGIIFSKLISLPKGQGVAHSYSVVIPIYTLNTFVSNGGSLYVTSQIGNMSVYNINLIIIRTHKAR